MDGSCEVDLFSLSVEDGRTLDSEQVSVTSDEGQLQELSTPFERFGSFETFFTTLRNLPVNSGKGPFGSCSRCELAKLFGQDGLGHYVCHTVYWPRRSNRSISGSDESIKSAINQLKEYRPTGSVEYWFISVHSYGANAPGNHIHAVHTCRTRRIHKDCRCGSIAKWRPSGFEFRRRFIKLSSEEAGRNLVLYLSKGKAVN